MTTRLRRLFEYHDRGQAAKTGQLVLPADGAVSWTAHADLADAAAAILAEEARFDGPTPPLTAAQAIDFDAITASAADLTGRPSSASPYPTRNSGNR